MAEYVAATSQHEIWHRQPQTGVPLGEMAPAPVSAMTAVQRTLAGAPTRYRPADLLTLQRTIGNRAVQRVVAQSLQRRDAVAAASPRAATPAPVGAPVLQRRCPSCSAALDKDQEGGQCSECARQHAAIQRRVETSAPPAGLATVQGRPAHGSMPVAQRDVIRALLQRMPACPPRWPDPIPAG